MDLAGTRDILSHSGTVPGNPGHLVSGHPNTHTGKHRHARVHTHTHIHKHSPNVNSQTRSYMNYISITADARFPTIPASNATARRERGMRSWSFIMDQFVKNGYKTAI